MKIIITTLVLSLGVFNIVLAQHSTKLESRQKVWIKETGSSKTITGYLVEVKDSSLIITSRPISGELKNITNPYEEIYYNRIERLKIRKSNILKNAGAGLLIGGIAWLALEGWSLKSNDDFLAKSFRDNMLVLGILAAIGVPIGLIAIPTHYKIKVNGDFGNFRENKTKLGESIL